MQGFYLLFQRLSDLSEQLVLTATSKEIKTSQRNPRAGLLADLRLEVVAKAREITKNE